MRKPRLLVLALAGLAGTLAAPAAAQDHQWTDDRPDAVAPVGIIADRTLAAGALEVGYRFSNVDAEGIKSGPDRLGEDDVLRIFQFVPIARSVDTHVLTLGYGVDDDITVMANLGYVSKRRETASADAFVIQETSDIADAEIDVLWDVWERGAYRAHVQLGAVIPLGSVEETGVFPDASEAPLPYDMQIGTGSWALVPGAVVATQNENGTVGLQLLGVIHLTENNRDWRPGNRVEANAWAAYRLNDIFSISSGVRASGSEAIEGFDVELETFRDPGDLSLSFGGTRVDIPLGLNVRLQDGPLAGHRFGVEFAWTVHENLDGPLLASDWGFTVGWQSIFDLGFGLF